MGRTADAFRNEMAVFVRFKKSGKSLRKRMDDDPIDHAGCTPKNLNQTPGLRPDVGCKLDISRKSWVENIWKSLDSSSGVKKKPSGKKKVLVEKKREHTQNTIFEPNLTPKSRFVESYFSHFSSRRIFSQICRGIKRSWQMHMLASLATSQGISVKGAVELVGPGRLLGMAIPTWKVGNPHNGYINPYWVDDHLVLYEIIWK